MAYADYSKHVELLNQMQVLLENKKEEVGKPDGYYDLVAQAGLEERRIRVANEAEHYRLNEERETLKREVIRAEINSQESHVSHMNRTESNWCAHFRKTQENQLRHMANMEQIYKDGFQLIADAIKLLKE